MSTPVEQVRAGAVEAPAPTRAQIIQQAKDVSPVARQLLVAAEQAAARDPRIGELPIEVYQAIIDSRAETDRQFFESWAQSIAENAAADKRAHMTYAQAREQEKRVSQSAALLVQQMRDAQKRGRLDMAVVNDIHARHGKVIIDAMRGQFPKGAAAPAPASEARATHLTQGPAPSQHAPSNALRPRQGRIGVLT